MGIPQSLIVVVYGLSLGMHLSKHGEPQNGKYNFWSALISATIIFDLLTWGGFFS